MAKRFKPNSNWIDLVNHIKSNPGTYKRSTDLAIIAGCTARLPTALLKLGYLKKDQNGFYFFDETIEFSWNKIAQFMSKRYAKEKPIVIQPSLPVLSKEKLLDKSDVTDIDLTDILAFVQKMKNKGYFIEIKKNGLVIKIE